MAGSVQVAVGSGKRCGKNWYKEWHGLVQGMAGFHTMCDRVWYKLWLDLVQGAAWTRIALP